MMAQKKIKQVVLRFEVVASKLSCQIWGNKYANGETGELIETEIDFSTFLQHHFRILKVLFISNFNIFQMMFSVNRCRFTRLHRYIGCST